MNNKGVLIVGHGSRLEDVNKNFMRLIKVLREETRVDLRGANLTLADPDVKSVVSEMYRDGHRNITIIPYFLSNGTHVVKNIPNILEELKSEYSDLDFNLESSLFMDDLVLKALSRKII